MGIKSRDNNERNRKATIKSCLGALCAGVLLAAAICVFPAFAKDGKEEEAAMVAWEVRFIEEGDQNKKILRQQNGNSVDGATLYVDFPEIIAGKDGWRYEALDQSPKKISVSGSGTQKYFVTYRKTERTEGEPDQKEEEKRLKSWLHAAKKADFEITGEQSATWQVITDHQEESQERLLNLVSMVHDGKRHEIYLIARNHSPSVVPIGQAFPDVKGVSELLLDEFDSEGVHYRVVRVRFLRTWEAESCTHELESQELVKAKCASSGHERFRCRLCGYEEVVIYPAAGHSDKDGDGICDVCDRPIKDGEDPKGEMVREGDVQIREIGGKPYRFRCIDEDYMDGANNNRYFALFLCEAVLPSSIGGIGKAMQKLSFGLDNNYKSSHIRTWLQENTGSPSSDISWIYTGVNTAYQGATGNGKYEQFDFDDLKAYEKPFQASEDQMFILSLEEAVKYRDFLWRFNGSSKNNPQSQYSPYAKGYYLRTPQYGGTGDFTYGSEIYAVDIGNGSLRPVHATDTDMGIRPAYVIPQHREQRTG